MSVSRDYGSSAAPPVGFADFSPTELYTLSENIAASIQGMNHAWRQLDKTKAHVGSRRDTKQLRQKAYAHHSHYYYTLVLFHIMQSFCPCTYIYIYII